MIRRTEIKPVESHKRGVAVVRHENGGFSLEMHWPVDTLAEANAFDSKLGPIAVSVAYLTIDERRALAAELLREI